MSTYHEALKKIHEDAKPSVKPAKPAKAEKKTMKTVKED